MKKEVKYRPILFSTPMVQAIDEERKKLTRRTKGLENISSLATEVIRCDDWKSQGDWVARFKFKGEEKYEVTNVIKCPFGQVGDILWVRETFTVFEPEHCETMSDRFYYKADHHETNEHWRLEAIRDGYPYKWKPNLFMPREACRTFLKITNVRVERLKDISEENAKAEGVLHEFSTNNVFFYRNYLGKGGLINARTSFMTLWESINGENSWDANPWVWVIEFEKVEKPTDFLCNQDK